MTSDAVGPPPPAPDAATGAVARSRTHGLARIDVVLAIAFFVFAMIPRVAWIEHNDRPPRGLNDPALYVIYADLIADGKGYINLDGHTVGYYPVGFPAVMGGLKKAQDILGFDRTVYSVKLMNGIFGAATVAMLFLLVRRTIDRRVAILSAGLLAIFPSQVFYTGTILSEPQFTMLLMAAMLVLLWNPWKREGMGYGQLAAVGLLLSAATMTRGITLMFPLVLFGVWFFYLHSRKRALLQTLVLFAGIAVLVVPWSIRNTLAFDTITGPSTNLGDDLCIGNFLGSDGKFTITGKCFEGLEDVPPGRLEIERNRHGTKTAIKDVINHPVRMPKLVAYKAYWLMHRDDDGLWAAESYGNDWFLDHPLREILSFAANSIYYAACALALLGLAAFMLSRDIRRLIIALTALYILAVPLAFFGDPRFHFPAVPFIIVIASATIIAFWDHRGMLRSDARASEEAPV